MCCPIVSCGRSKCGPVSPLNGRGWGSRKYSRRMWALAMSCGPDAVANNDSWRNVHRASFGDTLHNTPDVLSLTGDALGRQGKETIRTVQFRPMRKVRVRCQDDNDLGRPGLPRCLLCLERQCTPCARKQVVELLLPSHG